MTKRLVAVGSKQAAFHTVTVQYATSEPLWQPVIDTSEQPMIDFDELRKIDIESREDEL